MTAPVSVATALLVLAFSSNILAHTDEYLDSIASPHGGQVRMVHYRDGHLRNAQMPVGARRLGMLGIATPGQAKTSFAVGSIFKRSMPSVDQAPEVFEFRR